MNSKIGAIFLVSVLALAGIGVSYAGFTDEIELTGTVTTGTVDLTVIGVINTYVWKQISTHEMIVTDVPDAYSGEDYVLVGSAVATYDNEDDTVTITWDNIFPLQEYGDWCVYLTFKYIGTIPARIGGEITDYPDDMAIDDALTCNIYGYYADGIPIDIGYQVHQNDEFTICICLDVIQDNANQGLTGTYTAEITATQWNEFVEP